MKTLDRGRIHVAGVCCGVAQRLVDETRRSIIPAAMRGDFDEFSQSVYRYGHTAGMCFAPAQGGPYRGPRLNALVEQIRALGVQGVGQSSWGPTLFALQPHQDAAERFVARMASQPGNDDLDFTIAAPDNRGARIIAA